MSKSTKLAMLEQAAERLGRSGLAARLGVPETLVEAWLQGHASMPDRKFLLLADIIDEISNPNP